MSVAAFKLVKAAEIVAISGILHLLITERQRRLKPAATFKAVGVEGFVAAGFSLRSLCHAFKDVSQFTTDSPLKGEILPIYN